MIVQMMGFKHTLIREKRHGLPLCDSFMPQQFSTRLEREAITAALEFNDLETWPEGWQDSSVVVRLPKELKSLQSKSLQ